MTTTPGFGALPARWRSERARWLLERQSRPARGSDAIVTAFRDGQVTLRTNRRIEGFTEAAIEIGYHGIRKGDLVVHSMDAFAGAVGVSDSDGKASPVVHAYRARTDYDERFASYSLRALAQSGYLAALAKGIRERSTSFDPAALANLNLPHPSLLEQRRIADFLDFQTANIDRLTSARRAQISALSELELAQIGAELSGADQSGKCRMTGWGWLESIPNHWRMALSMHTLMWTWGRC